LSGGSAIYAPVYGTGLGHAYRTAATLRSLASDGHIALASSWGEGLRYLESAGIPCLEVPELDVLWGDEGKMRFKDTLRNMTAPFVRVAHQLEVEGRIIDSVRPSVVLSDSRLTPILAAKRRGLRSALILNQARIMAPRALGIARAAIEVPPAQILGSMWSAADLVIVPDLPPPYTVAEEQLRAIPQIRGKLRFAGFPVEACRGQPTWSPPRRPFALFAVSGPEETKRPALLKSISAARILGGRGWSALISAARPGSSGTPVAIGDGVYLCEWCGCIDQYIEMSDIVVARAGHTTVGKIIYYGKPGVLMPIPFHGEQESNALKAERMGIAKAILRSDMISGVELAEAVESTASDGAGPAARISGLARSMDFAELSASAVEELL